jgi:hypothetical protein
MAVGRWAVALAAAVAVVLVVSYAVFGVAYLVGGVEAIEDSWVGLLGAVALFGGLLASLVAFVLAVVAKVRHERRTLLWLPLSLFPVLVAVVVVVETFWME